MNLIDEKIDTYCANHSWKPSSVCQEIAEYTRAHIPQSQMLIGSLEASVLGFLIRSSGAKRVLEFGCFTGYSALAMAENLPSDGELITLDVNKETTEIAQRFWAKSNHGSKIRSILGPALESLKNLSGFFDFVFIDADKENYLNYLKQVLPRLNSNGIVVVDNCLWSGRVVDSSETTGATPHLREFNRFVCQAENLYVSLIPVRDGLFLIRKKN